MMSQDSNSVGSLRDRVILFIAAIFACAIVLGAFLFTETHHLSPMWVFVPAVSLGFFAQVGWAYRQEFRSASFCLFFFAWLLIHVFSFLFVVGIVGWIYWIPTLVAEVF